MHMKYGLMMEAKAAEGKVLGEDKSTMSQCQTDMGHSWPFLFGHI